MKIKKSILGITATTAFATVALVSCGSKDKAKSYTVDLSATTTVSYGNYNTDSNANEDYDVTVKNASELLEKLNAIQPTATGYTFTGWYTDKTATTPLTKDTDLESLKNDEGFYYVYAGLTLNSYAVTFDYGTGSTADTAGSGTTSVSVNHNGVVDATPVPATSAKRRYTNGTKSFDVELTFAGWYADAARTTVFDPTTKITKATTLYAKWTIAEIANEDDFLAYVDVASTQNAVITADLDFSGRILSRLAADLDAEKAQVNSSGSDVTISLKHNISGLGHTIKNLTVKSDLKCGGIWSSCTGKISDIKFEGAALQSTVADTSNSAFLVGQVNGASATFEDIVIDGLEVQTPASGSKNVGGLIGTVKSTANDVTIEGVIVKNATLTGKSYVGGLIGLVDKEATGSITVKDVIIDATVTGTERCCLVLGGIGGSGTSPIVITVDGAVLAGSITGKASAAILDNKSTASTIVVKNVVVDTLDITNTNDNNADLLFTLSSSTSNTTIENVVYREYGVNVQVKGDAGAEYKTDLQGTSAALNANLPTTISSNLVGVYDASTTKVTYTLEGLGTYETESDPEVKDVSSKAATVTSTNSNSIDQSTGNNVVEFGSNDYSLYSKIPYVQAKQASQAGNGVLLTITPNADITNSVGRKIVSTELLNAKINADGTISGYFLLTDADKETLETTGSYVSRTITIQWFNSATEVATPVQYKFYMVGGYVSFTNDFAQGDISLNSVSTIDDVEVSGVYTASDYTLTLSAEAEAKIVDNSGNYVTVNVTKATGYTGETSKDTIAVSSNAEVVSYADGVAVVKVKLAATKASTDFTISWNSAWDPDTYTIALGTNVSCEIKAGAIVAGNYIMSASDIGAAGLDSSYACGNYVTLVTVDTSKPWVVDGNSKTYSDGSLTHRAKIQTTANYISIDLTTVSGNVEFTFLAFSSSSSDTSRTITVADTKDGSTFTPVTSSGVNASGNPVTEFKVTLVGGTIYKATVSAAINFYGFLWK